VNNPIQYLLFDWGDTLMVDYPQCTGAMVTWPRVTPMEGVHSLMPKLSENYTCAVLSNAGDSDAALMKKAFEKAELEPYFQWFFTSKELGASKPNPMFFEQALQKLNASAGEAMMIGNDYEKDIVPARAVGMNTVLISKAAGNYLDADHVLDDFSALSFLL